MESIVDHSAGVLHVEHLPVAKETQIFSSMSWTLVVVATTLLGYYLYLRKKGTQFPSPKGIPLLGHVHLFNLFRYTDTFDKGHKELGDTVQYAFAYFKYIDSVNPQIVKQVVHNTERDDLYKYSLSDAFGNRSVILTSGARWKAQRKVLNPTLSTHHLHAKWRENSKFLAHPAQALVRRLHTIAGTNQPYELDTELSRVSLSVIGNTLFGDDLGFCNSNVGDSDHPLLVALWEGLGEFNKRLSNPLRKFLNPWAIWRFHKAQAEVRKVVMRKVEERSVNGNMNAQGEKFDDAMGALLDAAQQGSVDGIDFTFQDVMENIVTLILAGHETTAHTMAFALYEIAQHPEVESKLLAELDRFGSDRPITYEDLSGGELSYVGNVVQETLRLHPVAPSIMRSFHTGQPLDSSTAETDYNVGVTLTTLHMDERHWSSPHEFNPSRFSSDDGSERPTTAYLPFGGGPRTCIGKKLALLEMKYMIANMYRNFVFRLVPDFKYDVEITVTMHETHNMPLLVQPRRPLCTSG